MILTTSNLSESIDTAFVDRADIKRYIGNPGKAARYWILCDCLEVGIHALRKMICVLIGRNYVIVRLSRHGENLSLLMKIS